MAMDPFSVYKRQLALFFTMLIFLLSVTSNILLPNTSVDLQNSFFSNLSQKINLIINK